MSIDVNVKLFANARCSCSKPLLFWQLGERGDKTKKKRLRVLVALRTYPVAIERQRAKRAVRAQHRGERACADVADLVVRETQMSQHAVRLERDSERRAADVSDEIRGEIEAAQRLRFQNERRRVLAERVADVHVRKPNRLDARVLLKRREQRTHADVTDATLRQIERAKTAIQRKTVGERRGAERRDGVVRQLEPTQRRVLFQHLAYRRGCAIVTATLVHAEARERRVSEQCVGEIDDAIRTDASVD